MTNLWDKEGIPHKGWVNIDVIDNEDIHGQCEMCGKEDIRYAHIMTHPKYHNLSVGCVCAERMSEDYVTPRRLLDNAIKINSRYRYFLKDWEKFDDNIQIKHYKGYDLYIIKKFGMYRYQIDYNLRPWCFKTEALAKRSLFTKINELCNRQLNK